MVGDSFRYETRRYCVLCNEHHSFLVLDLLEHESGDDIASLGNLAVGIEPRCQGSHRVCTGVPSLLGPRTWCSLRCHDHGCWTGRYEWYFTFGCVLRYDWRLHFELLCLCCLRPDWRWIVLDNTRVSKSIKMRDLYRILYRFGQVARLVTRSRNFFVALSGICDNRYCGNWREEKK